MTAGDPVEIIDELKAIFRAIDRREELAADKGRPRDVVGDRIVVFRTEGRSASAETESKLVGGRRADVRVQARAERKILECRDAGTRKVVLAERLVLRFDLNAGD